MKKSSSKDYDRYCSSYEKLRRFLRPISYGCYARPHMQEHFSISPRTYDTQLHRLRFFLPPDYLLEHTHQKMRHISLSGDVYQGGYNYLITSYRIKSLLPSWCLLAMAILRLLHGSVALSTGCIFQKLQLMGIDTCSQIPLDKVTIHRALKDLTAQGLISAMPKGREIYYEEPPDPFYTLTDEEIKELLSAIAFYKNTALISVPGYDLENTLRHNHPVRVSCDERYQFKGSSFLRIIEDETIAAILQCIQAKRCISCSYGKKLCTLQPLRIETDYTYNRQYLIARDHHGISRLRIDRITNLSATPKIAIPVTPPTPSPNTTIILQVFPDSACCHAYLRHSILTRFPDTHVEKTNGLDFQCILRVNDPLRLLPWLRTLHPYVRISPSPEHNLHIRMKNDLKEALKNYANPVS